MTNFSLVKPGWYLDTGKGHRTRNPLYKGHENAHKMYKTRLKRFLYVLLFYV